MTAPVGSDFTVDVAVNGASNVGSYEVLVNYALDDVNNFEPGVLQFVSFTTARSLQARADSSRVCLQPTTKLARASAA